MNMNIAIIGAGGVGGWLAGCLAPMMGPYDNLWIVDGDKVEEKNLDRQRFTERDLGKFKADRLARTIQSVTKAAVLPLAKYVSPVAPCRALDTVNAVFLAVDNHVARKTILELSDRNGFPVFCGANEYTEASAWVYFPEWKGTQLDPRVRHPEILTSKAGDPMSPCTGDEAMESSPQLVTFNMLAASYAVHLFRVYFVEDPVAPELREYLPVSHEITRLKTFTRTQKDYTDERG
jgi:molybdopterin/thiamine biosynthesis adenylyltransferase